MFKPGFTLSEMLIALAILGVVAAFTVPKIMEASQYNKNISIVKETAGMVSQIHRGYSLQSSNLDYTYFRDYVPLINAVNTQDTTSVFDNMASSWSAFGPVGPSVSCANPSLGCVKMHNGAVLVYWRNERFGAGTPSTRALRFYVDPDGTYNGTAGVGFWLSKNGLLRTYQKCTGQTSQPDEPFLIVGCIPKPGQDPPWFKW